MFPTEILDMAEAVLKAGRARGWRVATAESCTGGLVAGALTEIAGSSDVVDRGFVTYSNAAKTALLGVPAAMIEAHGAVSEATARAMAAGALAASEADVAVAITGVAGPGGGSAEKPVGLVWFGLASRQGVATRVMRFGDLALQLRAVDILLADVHHDPGQLRLFLTRQLKAAADGGGGALPGGASGAQQAQQQGQQAGSDGLFGLLMQVWWEALAGW